jgi:hypothetical protein
LPDFGVNGIESRPEPAGYERLVGIDGESLRPKTVEPHLRAGLALKRRTLGRDVDDAAGVDIAVGESARAAADLKALGVVDILHGIPWKAVAQLSHARQAANVHLISRSISRGRADRALRIIYILGADREVDRIEVIVEGEILDEFVRHDRDRVGQVFQFLVCARGAHRSGGRVTLVLFGAHLENAQHDGRFGLAAARGWGSLNLRQAVGRQGDGGEDPHCGTRVPAGPTGADVNKWFHGRRGDSVS